MNLAGAEFAFAQNRTQANGLTKYIHARCEPKLCHSISLIYLFLFWRGKATNQITYIYTHTHSPSSRKTEPKKKISILSFPSQDPVAITLILSADCTRALLIKYPNLPLWTCCAGFIDQGSVQSRQSCVNSSPCFPHHPKALLVPPLMGNPTLPCHEYMYKYLHKHTAESVEECARREMKEELGIDCSLDKIRLVGSQPWPAGRGGTCELMVGVAAILDDSAQTIRGEQATICTHILTLQKKKKHLNPFHITTP